MKKLLVLSLVLAVAGLANAGLTLTAVDTAGGVMLTVSNDLPMLGGINDGLAVHGEAVTIGDIVLRVAGAPAATATITRYDAAILAEYALNPPYGSAAIVTWGDPDPQIPSAAGLWFTAELIGFKVATMAGPGTVQIDLVDGNVVSYGQSVFLTPEPMTMVLLGLGGLFLRKKK